MNSLEETKHSTSRRLLYSSGNLAVQLMAQAFATYIVFYYVDELHVRPGLISIAMMIHGIFNAVLNPLIGYISDRTHTRWGRRLPYIAIGLIPLAATFTLLWIPLTSGAWTFWYFLLIVLLYDVLFVMVVLNYSAVFPEMFTSMKERAMVSSWRQLLGIIGLMLGVAAPPLIYGQIGWEAMGLIFGSFIALFLFLSLLGTKENLAITPGKYSLITAVRNTLTHRAFVFYVAGSFFVQFTFSLIPAGIPFYTKYVLNEAETSNTYLLGAIFVVALAVVYVWGKVLQRLGARKTVLISITIYAMALAPFAWVNSLFGAVLTAACIGIGLAGLLVLLDVLLSEVIDEDEKKTGERREGMYFGMNGFIVRWGVSLQAAVLGAILEFSSYDAELSSQPPEALLSIRFMLSALPIVVLIIALALFYFYPIGKNNSSRISS